MFVVLEGIDGSGTTTQAQQIAERLRGRGIGSLVTAEPSTGELGLLLRRALRREVRMSEATLALLFAADRIDHLEREILPALAEGRVVICDRYLMSSWAYQALDLPLEWVRILNARAQAPDLTLFLDVDPAVAAKRRHQRGGAEEHFDALATQRRVAENYRALAAGDASGSVIPIDANASPSDVEAACWTAIESHLKRS